MGYYPTYLWGNKRTCAAGSESKHNGDSSKKERGLRKTVETNRRELKRETLGNAEGHGQIELGGGQKGGERVE